LAKELEYFSPSFANEFRVEKKTRKERKMGRETLLKDNKTN